jgi:hypothetical protein
MLASAAGVVLARSALALAQTQSTTAGKTGYAPVNGLNVYYEIHGSGKPLILLPDGLGSTAMFDNLLPLFSKTRQVIAVDLQAHGRTADIDRPITYEAMADDIAALMKNLHNEKADLMGYSPGGGRGPANCHPPSHAGQEVGGFLDSFQAKRVVSRDSGGHGGDGSREG